VVLVCGAILWVSLGVLRGDGGDDWPRRGAPTLAWVGDRLFVYGGLPVPDDDEDVRTVTPLNDAALIDPATDDVDLLPDPPFDRPLRGSPAAAEVDGEVFLMGQLCREPSDDARACDPGGYRAAVYAPERGDWRNVTLPGALATIVNGQSTTAGVTSDGRVVLVLGGQDAFGALAGRQLWTYDVAGETWAPLPAPPSLVESVCLTGDVVVVGSGLVGATAGVEGPSLSVLDLAGGADTWLPTGPADVIATVDRPTMACGTDEVLVDVGDDATRIYLLGPTGGWSEPAQPPGDDLYSTVLWSGEEFFFLDPNPPNLAYDPGTDEWRGLQNAVPTGFRAVWTGDLVVGWPGRTDLPSSFAP